MNHPIYTIKSYCYICIKRLINKTSESIEVSFRFVILVIQKNYLKKLVGIHECKENSIECYKISSF